MNYPTSIRGFTTYAPAYPDIKGLHFTQFARALCAAFQERAYPVGGVSTYFDPDIVQGTEGTKGGPSRFIYRFDESLNALCKVYANQYSVGMQENWTFDTLLAKAAEVLGLQNGEEIANRMRNFSRGFSTAAWGVQRATMLSLLTHFRIDRLNNGSGRHCHFYTYKRFGRVAIQNIYPQRENIEDAIDASSVELESEYYSYGASLYRFENRVIWQSMDLGGTDRYCDIERTEQAYLVPNEYMSLLLDCDAFMITHFEGDEANRSYYDDMGENYTEGLNLINTHIDSNGVFWNAGAPSYPAQYQYPQQTIGYMGIMVGYGSNSYYTGIVAIFGNKFNYQLVW